jgi:riboflavin synthase
MFTGLVAETGAVLSIERDGEGTRLEVRSGLARELEPGDSVAVSGVCLTAREVRDESFSVDVVSETLRRSSLAGLAEGASVNLELPLRAADRLGGHLVQGHVDGVGTLESVVEEGFSRRVAFRAPEDVCRYVVDKGSVAIDGVSLTAADVWADGFSVALIPETIERTTLGGLTTGAPVNIEVDVLAKYVERLMPEARAAELAAQVGEPR